LNSGFKARGYNVKLFRNQILKARKHRRDDQIVCYKKLVLNSTDLYLAYSKFFSDISNIGFKRGKNLKEYVVRAKLPVKQEVGKSEGCQSKRCNVHATNT